MNKQGEHIVKTLLLTGIAAAILISAPVFADDAEPIELTASQMDQITAAGTVPNSNSSFVAQVAATWPGPKGAGGFFAPPPGSIALFAELTGMSVSEVVAFLNSL